MSTFTKWLPQLSCLLAIASVIIFPLGNTMPSIAVAIVAIFVGVCGITLPTGTSFEDRVLSTSGIFLAAIVAAIWLGIQYLNWAAMHGQPL